MTDSAGEGELFRVFNCTLPTQEKNGILFNQKPRVTPHLLPPVEVFREGETDVVQLVLKLTSEKAELLFVWTARYWEKFLDPQMAGAAG